MAPVRYARGVNLRTCEGVSGRFLVLSGGCIYVCDACDVEAICYGGDHRWLLYEVLESNLPWPAAAGCKNTERDFNAPTNIH